MYVILGIYLLTMARLWHVIWHVIGHVKLRSGPDQIPLLVHALFDPALLQVCSWLLHPVPASARRFLRVIYCFSSRPLRHHGRQRAAPQQQSSNRPLRRRRCSLRRLSRPRGRRQARPAAGVTRRLLHKRNVSVSDKLCNSCLKGEALQRFL